MSSLYAVLALITISLLSAHGHPQATINLNKRTGEGKIVQTDPDFYECFEDGQYEDLFQCDKYWICKHGVAKPTLCDDGLVFNVLKADGRPDPCDSIHVVDCTTKPILQNATNPHKFCGRRNGLFAHPDPEVCNIYYTCIQGRPNSKECTKGLHFKIGQDICTWKQDAARVGCAPEKPESLDGFTCPNEKVINQHGQAVPHPNYPHMEDCQKFYTCLHGKTPRRAVCNLGQVFNERNGMCDYPENVPECDGWYKNDPRFSEDYLYDDEVEVPVAK